MELAELRDGNLILKDVGFFAEMSRHQAVSVMGNGRDCMRPVGIKGKSSLVLCPVCCST